MKLTSSLNWRRSDENDPKRRSSRTRYDNVADRKVPIGEEKMPKMSAHNPYLTPFMVKTGDLVKILDKGEFIDAEDTKFNREVFQIPVQLSNLQKKIWTMNKTTRDNLTPTYGDDTEDWIGKFVKIKITEQNIRGETKMVIYGYPVETPLATQKIGLVDQSNGKSPIFKQ